MTRKQWALFTLGLILSALVLIVGTVVYLAYIHLPGSAIEIHALLGAMGSVALGELVICYALGLPLLSVLRRMPKLFPDAGK